MESKDFKEKLEIEFLKSKTYTEINEMFNQLNSKNKALLDEIEQLKLQLKAADSVNEWISVEDRLPENRERVLCFPKNHPFYYIIESDYECYTNKDLEWFKESFTHWMPLPNQPK